MEFHLGAQMRNPDGKVLGTLQRVVYQQESSRVVSLVALHGGWTEREVFVPIGQVQAADDEAVEITLRGDQYDMLDIYSETRNVAPPPDAAEVSSDLVHEPVDVPDVLPVGAATGVESIAFTPIVEELSYVLPGEQVIDHSTVVWAIDGEVGKVSSVLVDDETMRLSGFLAQRGVIFTHSARVPMEWVENVLPETIVLTVDRATVERAQEG